MLDFPRTISRGRRTLLGLVGVVGVVVVWWLVTLPVFSETRTVHERVQTGETETVRDPLTGAPVEVPVVEMIERTETGRRALINPPALEPPVKTLRHAWHLLTTSTATRARLDVTIWASTRRILIGFLVSTLIALPLGIAMGLYPVLRALLSPIVSFLRPLPSISWVPLMIIWFGSDEFEKIAIIFMGTFAAALIYTIEATVKVDPTLVRAARNLGVGDRRLLRKVLLPAALPDILSGLKVVLAIGWTCVISAEIAGTREGLGALIWDSKEISDTSAVLVGIVCISTIVLILDWLFARAERMLVPWRFAGEAT